MPFINTTVTCRIDDNKRETLKTLLGEAIALIPGKSEKFLMLAFSDGVKMYFSAQLFMMILDISFFQMTQIIVKYQVLIILAIYHI